MTYDPDCRTDSYVYVNGDRLPVGDVDIYMRKEGPLDFTRYVEGKFYSPVEINGEKEHFTQHFNGLGEGDEQESWDELTVRVLPEANREDEFPQLIFRGLVTGVGNSPGPEKEWHFRAQGPGMFLNKVAASIHAHNQSIEEVLNYVAEEFSDHTPYDVSVLLDGEYTDSGLVRARFNTTKTFQRNKHTLADVVTWMRDKVGGRIWFALEPEQLLLFATDDPTHPEHKATYLDGDIPIVNNDALVELTPICCVE